jgi:hypothetical protein
MVASRRAKADSAIILEGISVLELLLEKDPAALDALDNYIESFTGWHAGWKSRVSEHPSDKELKAVGAEVAKQHSEVLRLAGELKESISAPKRITYEYSRSAPHSNRSSCSASILGLCVSTPYRVRLHIPRRW